MSGRAPARPDEELLSVLQPALRRAFFTLSRTVQKNLAVLTAAFLHLLGAARGGYGRLSLGTLYRLLPTSGTPHAREKRLHRFLKNPRLDPRGVSEGLARLIFGPRGQGLWPIVFDQTKSGATQALLAGVPLEGRVLPLAVYTFDYPWQETACPSQNHLEHVFLLDVEGALPAGVRGVFIGDRGYARAALLRQSASEGRLYVIRGRAGTRIHYQGRSLKLHQLPHPVGDPVRYREVRYQAREQIGVDVVAFHDPQFREPWWLLLPPHSEGLLPTATVVALYRERMQVEQSFRDFKTHLGWRGLQLRVQVAERTGRLLLAFCIAYSLALVLGLSPEAAQARADLEIPRRRPRHHTCRTLSVLSIATLMLAHPRWKLRAAARLHRLVFRLALGRPLLRRGPPHVKNLQPALA